MSYKCKLISHKFLSWTILAKSESHCKIKCWKVKAPSCCFTQASSSFNVFKIKGQVFPRMENKWSLCVFNILHKRDSCSRTFAALHLILIIEPETLLLPEQCIGPALARGGQTCEQQLSSWQTPQERPALLWAHEALPFHAAACSHCWRALQPYLVRTSECLVWCTEEIMWHSFQLERVWDKRSWKIEEISHIIRLWL